MLRPERVAATTSAQPVVQPPFLPKTAKGRASMIRWITDGLRSAIRSQDGVVAIQMAVSLAALLGMAGLATDVGLVVYKQRQMQAAADAAAFSGAMAAYSGHPQDFTAEAKAVAGQNGFVNATNGVTVTVNNAPTTPPAVNTYPANGNYVQVIIKQPQSSPLAGIVYSGTFTASAQAVAEISGGVPACVLALQTSGTPMSLNGGTQLSAPNCVVASQGSIAASGSAKITAKAVHYNGSAPSITGGASISPAPTKASTPDPLAGNAGIVAAAARAVADETLPSPTIASVPSGASVTFGYTQYPPTMPAGCAATGPQWGGNWTVKCNAGGNYNFGSLTVSGGTVTFSGSATYNFSGTVTNNGSLTFGPGTFNMAGGLVTGGGSTTSFGAGTFNIGQGPSCSGAQYSICNSGQSLTFGGPSTFVLTSGIYNSGGEKITFGAGSTNSYTIGAASNGDAFNDGSGATTTFADATGSNSVFKVVGNLTEGGGSCLTLPAATNHDINGTVTLAGGLTLGAGLYAVTGSFLVGASGGGDVWCQSVGTNVGVYGLNVAIAVAGSGAASGSNVFVVGSGFGHVTISAPSSGTYQSVAIVGPLSASATGGMSLNQGASNATVNGALYFPNGTIALDGGASIGNGANQCLEIVANQVTLTGGTAMASSCPFAGGSSAQTSPFLVE
jgi:Flp pilus assembly protein TadG